MMAKPGDAPLFERYKLAYAEYRAEVALGTERQKLFITLNPVIAALSASARVELAAAALMLAAVASLVGMTMVGSSHARYQQARNVLLGLAKELGTEHDWQTTGGMRELRGEPRWHDTRRVSTSVKLLLSVYLIFDVIAAVMLLRAK